MVWEGGGQSGALRGSESEVVFGNVSLEVLFICGDSDGM